MGEIITEGGVRVPIGAHAGKKIYIASDHAAFDAKRYLIPELEKEFRGLVTDLGTDSPERCDYPLFSKKLGIAVSTEPNFGAVGIGMCGSGKGILIPATKRLGVYGSPCYSTDESRDSRIHNNTNALGIGARITEDPEEILDIVMMWMITPFFSDPEKEHAYLQRYVQTVLDDLEEHGQMGL